MNGPKLNKSLPPGTGCSGAVSRFVLWWIAGGVLVGVAGWLLVRGHGTASSGPAVAGNEAQPVSHDRPMPARPDPGSTPAAPATNASPRGPATVAPGPLAVAAPPVVTTPATPYTRELIKSLYGMELGTGGITSVQAQQWKSNLWNLVQSGPAGAAAIREFMEKNTDYDFSVVKGGNQLSFPTLRTTLIDALANIGGAEATDALLFTLRSTAEPREIALLGRALDQLAPGGDYRPAVVEAARSTLALAADDKLGGVDVTPLFETFVHFGDSAAVLELQNAVAGWPNYANIALAQLPGGSGVPALIALANNASSQPGGDPSFNYAMLAQMTASYPDAASALLGQARENRIPESSWPSIASALAGLTIRLSNTTLGPGQTQETSPGLVSYGTSLRNQQYYSVRVAGQWSPDQIQQQIHLIDGLLALNPPPTAVSALQNSRKTLTASPSP